jgi:hypothetical protein
MCSSRMQCTYLQDLENLYENTRQDLLVTQEALAKFQSSQQVSFTVTVKP